VAEALPYRATIGANWQLTGHVRLCAPFRHRKRMAELACVYDLTPTPRTVVDILPDSDADRASARPAPVAAGKWLHASVTDDAAAVIAAGFDQATRRDPDHRRDWVVLVDGNTHQLDHVHPRPAPAT
jgi:hypothetical protein